MGTRKQQNEKKLILKLIPNLHEQSWRVEGGLGRKSKHTRIEGHGRYKPTEKQEQMKTPKRKNSKLKKKIKIKKTFFDRKSLGKTSSGNEREVQRTCRAFFIKQTGTRNTLKQRFWF